MKQLLFVLAFCSVVFAQTDYVSYMPKAMLNFDSLIVLPQTPEEILNPNLPDFVTMSIDSGAVCKTKHAILVSEKKVAESAFWKYGYLRLQKEMKLSQYLLNFHDSIAVAVEKNIYWKELKNKDVQIAQLVKSNQRNWWEKNNIYIGVVLGAALAILTEYAVIQAKK